MREYKYKECIRDKTNKFDHPVPPLLSERNDEFESLEEKTE